MVCFAPVVAVALLPFVAGLVAGSQRQPGLVGVRDAFRDHWSRDNHHDGIMANEAGVDDGTAKKDPLRCFEVHHPVLTPQGPAVDERPVKLESRDVLDHDSASCDVLLMEYSFGNSYGSPFVAQYQPPDCAFDRVVLRLDVVSEGRQFDRLAVMYLGDVEVWRTSTAEPKPSPGILWTIRKDFTPYLPLWREPQTLIFDLGNLVNEKYTGAFNATLTATFFESDVLGPNGVTADVIVPISAQRGAEGKASAFIYPETPAESVLVLPRNINRAMLTVSATGQAGEEFWWSNVPEKDKDVFSLEAGPLPGLSSFREVQVRVDGQVVGLTWPFPVVFTGGVAPPLHRPIASLQAFDLREHEIDVSPFLGLLCDGKEHTFSIDVFGIDDSEGEPRLAKVPMHWVLSGKLFLWLDDQGSQTTGGIPEISIRGPDYTADTQAVDGVVVLDQTARRWFHVVAQTITQSGVQIREWHQMSSMTWHGSLADKGDTQYVDGLYENLHSSVVDKQVTLFTKGVYPIISNSTYREPDGDYDFSLKATLNNLMTLNMLGQRVFPTGLEPFYNEDDESQDQALIHTSRSSDAFFYSMNGGNSSSGTGNTEQTYMLTGSTPLYERSVSVSNESTIYDFEVVLGRRNAPLFGANKPARAKRQRMT